MATENTQPDFLWVIDGDDFLLALNRAYTGEDPDMIYLEFYANSEIEKVEGEE